MKVISVNIGDAKTVQWNGRNYTTGIFKKPVEGSIHLGNCDVKGDNVIDRQHHGGIDKACYIYSADNYSFWEAQYPNLTFVNGMFGENLTIEGLDEKRIYIGDRFKVGDALVEVSQPREPCSTLKLRFNDSQIVRKFFKAPYPGLYLRVLEEGKVEQGDFLKFVENKSNRKYSIFECYDVLKTKDGNTISDMLKLAYLSEAFKGTLRKINKI